MKNNRSAEKESREGAKGAKIIPPSRPRRPEQRTPNSEHRTPNTPFGKHVFLLALLLLLFPREEARAQAGAAVRIHHLALTATAPKFMSISNVVVLAFGTNAAISDGRVLVRAIQNTGTNAFWYGIAHTNLNAATNVHGVVAGGLAANDGLGSIVDLSRFGHAIWVRCTNAGGTTLLLVEGTQ